jgi:hypothetical protein
MADIMEKPLQKVQFLLREKTEPYLVRDLASSMIRDHQQKCGLRKCVHLLSIRDRAQGRHDLQRLPVTNLNQFL